MSSKFAGMTLEVEKPSRMTIVHPVSRQPLRDASGVEAFIELYSGDSEVARKHHRAVQRRRLAMKGRGKISPEELEAEQVEFLCALTTGWHLLALDGSAMEVGFSAENARDLYAEPALSWLREQVDEFIGDRGNFSKASSKN